MFLRFLIYYGLIVTLLYLPSGLLHLMLGPWVYLRDIAMMGHLGLTLAYLLQTRYRTQVLFSLAPLVLLAFLLVPGAFHPDNAYLPEPRLFTAVFLKNIALWMDWVVLGFAMGVCPKIGRRVWWLVVAGLGLLLVDWVAGMYEYLTNMYLLPVPGDEKTSAGTILGKQMRIDDFIRLKGLQRDVFSFANLMAAGSAVGLAMVAVCRKFSIRFLGGGLFALFAGMLFLSSGRSAFMGVGFAVMVAAMAMLSLRMTARQGWLFFAFFLAVNIFLCWVGIGTVVETVSSLFLADSHIGDSRSAFMREDVWDDILTMIRDNPVILFVGAPSASVFWPHIEPVFDRIEPIPRAADNQFFWLLYHTGIAGCGLLLAFFAKVLSRCARGVHDSAGVIFLIFTGLVLGEASSRESLFFMAAMPMFVSAGFLLGKGERRDAE